MTTLIQNVKKILQRQGSKIHVFYFILIFFLKVRMKNYNNTLYIQKYKKYPML